MCQSSISFGRTIVASPEFEDCVGSESENDDCVNQGSHACQVDVLRAAFGEEAAEGIVEPAVRRNCPTTLVACCGSRRYACIAAGETTFDRAAQVMSTVGERLGQGLAQCRARSAWPEQRPDRETHRAADSHILNADESDSPPCGIDNVVQINSQVVKPACPAVNETAAGARPAKTTASGSSSQKTVVFVPRAKMSPLPIRNPTTVPSKPRRAFWPVELLHLGAPATTTTLPKRDLRASEEGHSASDRQFTPS